MNLVFPTRSLGPKPFRVATFRFPSFFEREFIIFLINYDKFVGVLANDLSYALRKVFRLFFVGH